MKTQNITIALPVPLLRRVKALAARRGTSVSALLRLALEKEVDDQVAYHRAMEEALADLERTPETGWNGKVTWTRDELHERG